MTTESNPLHGRFLRRGESQAGLFNIANVITIIRILLAPVFVWMLLEDDGALGPLRYAAAILFVVSIATDALDGYLARSRNLVTNFGIFWDPLADKILIGSALVALSILGELWWWVTIVILVREFGITIYRLIALRDRAIPASLAGKSKTMAQAIATSLFLFPIWVWFGEWAHWISWIAMGVALVLTVYSGIEYLVGAWKLSKAK